MSALLAAIALPRTAAAQALSLAEAMELAVANSELTAIAEREIERRDAIADTTRGAFLPTGDLQGTLTRNDTQITVGDRNFTNLWDYSARAQVVVPLLRFDDWTTQRSQRTSVEAARERLELEAANLRLATARAYLAALTADANHDATVEQVRVAEASLEQTRALADAGFLVPADVAQAELQLVQAQNNEVRASLESGNALANLAFLVGRDEAEFAQVSLTPPELPSDLGAPLILADVRAAELDARSARQLQAAAREDWLPTLQLVGQYNFTRPSLRAENGTFWTVNLTLNWVFLDLTRQPRLQTARVQEEIAVLTAARAQRTTDFARDNAERTRESTLAQVSTAERQVETARTVQTLVGERFQAGEVTILEMTQADSAVFQAEIALNVALLQRDLAQLDLLFLNGLLETPWTEDAP